MQNTKQRDKLQIAREIQRLLSSAYNDVPQAVSLLALIDNNHDDATIALLHTLATSFKAYVDLSTSNGRRLSIQVLSPLAAAFLGLPGCDSYYQHVCSMIHGHLNGK